MKARFAVWWLNPILLFTALNGGLALAAMATPDAAFAEHWSTPKFFTGQSMAVSMFCILAFALGALLPEAHFRGWAGARDTRSVAPLPVGTLLALYRTAIGLALFGYLVWGAIAISNGMSWQIVKDVVSSKPGAAYLVRYKYLISVGGVTTATQFGVAAAILGSLVAAQTGWRKIWKSLSLLYALAVVRALLNTERLAILELVIPMVPVIVTQILRPRADGSRWLKRAITWAPLAGIGGVFVIFAAFEYGRSWTTYYSGGPDSFWTFAMYRLTGYYITALNNSSFLLSRLPTPEGIPFFTLNFLWHFPFVDKMMHALFPTFDLLDTYFSTLDTGANAEFNNGGGLLAPAIDFGSYGVTAFWLLAGLISGWAYRQFKRGAAWGLCLYPMLFLGTLEVPRGLYLSGGRAVPPICFLLLSASLLAIRQNRSTVAAEPAPPPLALVLTTS